MAPKGRAKAAAARPAAGKAAEAKAAGKAAAEGAIGDEAVAQPPVVVKAAVAAKAAVKAKAAFAAKARARRAAQAAADEAGGRTGACGGGLLALGLAGVMGRGGVIRPPWILGGAAVGFGGGLEAVCLKF